MSVGSNASVSVALAKFHQLWRYRPSEFKIAVMFNKVRIHMSLS